MKYKIILLILISFINCKKKANDIDLNFNTIKVYYLPFEISSMAGSSIENLRTFDSSLLNEEDLINAIKIELSKLKPSKEDSFMESSLHVLCDFYDYKKEKKITLLFDKTSIRINGKMYEKNEDLINGLIYN